jgi:AAA family ATP:ADP antiporter
VGPWARASTPPALARGDAFRLVFGNRYLRLVAMLILLLNIVNTTGEYVLGRTVAQAAAARVASGEAGGADERQLIGEFYARFFSGVNVLSLVLQLFVVSRILRLLGVRLALLVLPAIAAGTYGLLVFQPALAAIRWGKTVENATDYSLQNTLRAVLFLPTTREEKYKAKQAIDTFVVRTGDVLSAVLVWTGVNLLAFGAPQFAMVNLVLIGGWVLLALAIGRRHQELVRVAERRHALAIPK